MDNKGFMQYVLAGGIILILMLSLFFGVIFSAKMEAKQFNKFSTTKITWWDAMWADYRILPN